jgi:hypothetical protein
MVAVNPSFTENTLTVGAPFSSAADPDRDAVGLAPKQLARSIYLTVDSGAHNRTGNVVT